MTELRIDFETRSDVDLLKAGVYAYATSPHADVLMASYQFGRGPVARWVRGQPCPPEIAAHVAARGRIVAFNAGFERIMWWAVLTSKHGWPKPALEQFVCTAVTAAALSLPRSLDRLGAALELKVQKDKDGRALIKFFCMPAGWTPTGAPIWNEPEDHPEKFARFQAYCDVDVLTEAEADERLIPLSDEELEVYWLNERINDRGIRIDVQSARAALAIVESAKARLDKEMKLATAGYVGACTEVAALTRWVELQGVPMETMGKDDIDDLLEAIDLPDNVRHALELRQEAAKTSVSKIASMLDRVCDDGRVRGVYLHHGAGQTGRFSSRGLQAHNMPKYRKVFEEAHPRADLLFDTLRYGDPGAIEFMYGPKLGRPLHLLSDAIRGFLWAAPGHELIDVDYTSIEGVLAAWFSGEEWKLQAFRELIAGTGPGMYELLASKIYRVPVEAVTKPQRGVGKVGELSMGYQGGVGALSRMARANKLKLHTVFDSVWETSSPDRREKAENRYEERLEKKDDAAIRLGREGWLAAELIKVGWRAEHPATVAAWGALDEAATQAVMDPGSVQEAVRVRYRVAHGFLFCQLPSGRCLAYGRPRLQEVEAPWADKTLPPKEREKKISVTVLGVDSQTERWTRFPIYGGSLFNNVVQGSARDILVNGMKNAEAGGYKIILHTHDEMAAEMPRGVGSVEELSALANRLPGWCLDLPLKASGWRGKRYRKD
jgi:DNA polymerase